MNIDTTIIINRVLMGSIYRASFIYGLSKTSIVSSLMRRLADDHEKMVKSWSRVRYQERDAGKNWRRMHLSLRPDEYEFFLDLRKAFKCSVSFLIAYAIEKYLDEIVKKIRKNPDNYRYKNYMISRIIIDEVICWMYYWGIPRSLLSNAQIIISQSGLHST